MKTSAKEIVLLFATAVPVGCADEIPAPSNYAVSTSSGLQGLEIDCSELPTAAIGAAFDYTPTVTDVDGPLYFELVGESPELPAGLTFDTTSAAITGIPSEEGAFEFDIRVTDVDGNTAQAQCSLSVAPQLVSAFEPTASAPCARLNQSLLSFVVDETGDGSPIACSFDGGPGDGQLPAGLTIDPERCTVTGTPVDQAYGTKVFLMRGSQSGVDLHIPYCVTRDDLPAGAYTVYADHSGLVDAGATGTEAALTPMVGTFDSDQPLAIGGAEVEFRVVSADSCGAGPCYYGYVFSFPSTPFDPDGFSMQPDALLENADGDPIGFTHSLSWSGDPPGEEFADRPFVAPISMTYCIAGDNVTCSGNENVASNGQGSLDFAIIMWPA